MYMFIFRDSDEKTLDLIKELVKVVERDEGLKKKVVKSFERIDALKTKYLQ